MSRKHPRGFSTDVDQGFTLIEVIVALMLMSIVLMAGGAFMIRAVTSSSAVSGRQGAVTVANQVMEQIRSVDATLDDAKKSPLVYGRDQLAVKTQWLTAPLDRTETYIGDTGILATPFDADTYRPGGLVTVPLQQVVSLNNQKYTVDALIGTCGRPDPESDCIRNATGYELYRVVVRVTWSLGAGEDCSGSPCAYVVSTLIDATKEPTFNASRKPLAKPDTATTPVGTVVNIGITANDSGDFALAGAVTMITNPAHGTYVLNNNIVTFTPTAGYSGPDTFTYTVTDLTSRVSNVATVTVSITPVGVNDTANANAGATASSLPVLSNDKGTGLSLVSLTAPSIGSAVISGTNILYTPPLSGSGVVTVTYTAKDSSGQQYTATLTINVTGISPVPLGTAGAYSAFAGSALTNTGATTLSRSVGAVTTITGFPSGTYVGTRDVANAATISARAALTVAYNDAATRTGGTVFSGDLAAKTFTPGVYKTGAAMALTGTVTLDAAGDPNAVFIFQINGALNTAAASNVKLINGADPANVFWQSTGAAGIGAGASFSGNILSFGAITVGAGAQVRGRALSYAAITLATNTFS